MTAVENEYEIVGDRLREERERLGYKLGEFAELIGTTRQTQSKYEKGIRKPEIDYLIKAENLGINTFYVLFGFDRSPAPINEHNIEETLQKIVAAPLNNRDFRSDSITHTKSINDDGNTIHTITYIESDQGNREKDHRSLSQERIGSDDRSKLENDHEKMRQAMERLKSTTSNNLEPLWEDGSLDPSSEAKHGSLNEPEIDKYDLVEMRNELVHTGKLDVGELTSLGKYWSTLVSELNESQRISIYTLVFNHVISKFIELNMEREGGINIEEVTKRLSNFLNDKQVTSGDKKASQP